MGYWFIAFLVVLVVVIVRFIPWLQAPRFDALWPVEHLPEKKTEEEFATLLRVDRENNSFTITSTPHFRVVHPKTTDGWAMAPLVITVPNLRIDAVGSLRTRYWGRFVWLNCRTESEALVTCKMDRVPLLSIAIRGEESSPIDIYPRNGWSASELHDRISRELFDAKV
jgi:hypothetical protein